MFTTLVNRILLIYESIRTFFAAIKQITKWLYEIKAIRYLIYFCFTCVVIWIALFFYFISSIENTAKEIRNDYDLKTPTDAIIVYTGGSERIRHSLYLLDNGLSNKLFISGVNIKVRLVELLDVHDIPKEKWADFAKKITLGYNATDTIQNAEEIKSWIKSNKINSIRLVTSNYHIDRALIETEYKLQQDDIKIYPHPVIPINVRIDKWWAFAGTRNLLLSEYNKLIASWIRINLEKLGIIDSY
jgi:uncharacterized SAM-binding protein YcdF (DUF218 family)